MDKILKLSGMVWVSPHVIFCVCRLATPGWNWRNQPKTEGGGEELWMTCAPLGDKGFKSK